MNSNFKINFTATQSIELQYPGGGLKGVVARRNFRSSTMSWSDWEFTGDVSLSSEELTRFTAAVKDAERAQIAINPRSGI